MIRIIFVISGTLQPISISRKLLNGVVPSSGDSVCIGKRMYKVEKVVRDFQDWDIFVFVSEDLGKLTSYETLEKIRERIKKN